jgi:hypothetical protein
MATISYRSAPNATRFLVDVIPDGLSLPVIARSVSDEAIQSCRPELDCFATLALTAQTITDPSPFI